MSTFSIWLAPQGTARGAAAQHPEPELESAAAIGAGDSLRRIDVALLDRAHEVAAEAHHFLVSTRKAHSTVALITNLLLDRAEQSIEIVVAGRSKYRELEFAGEVPQLVGFGARQRR